MARRQPSSPGTIPRRRVAFAVALVLGLALAPAAAHANVGAGMIVQFPLGLLQPVTVGQTGVAADVTLTNDNDGGQTNDANTVCNVGDASPPCGSPEAGIVAIPACQALSGATCTTADPGVLSLSSTGTGEVGTECPNVPFNIDVIDASTGQVRFTPQPPGTHVTLAPAQSCSIDFTFDVLKFPTVDVNPGMAGTQTGQTGSNRQSSGALSAIGQAAGNSLTVKAGPPTLVTGASPNTGIGGQLIDTAVVSGLVNPIAGATVTFDLYPPADTTCTGTPVFSDTQPVTLNGTSASAISGSHSPTENGVFRWIATYNGDANNLPVSGVCNDPSEVVLVGDTFQPPPLKPPAPVLPDLALFTGSPKTLRVSKLGSFTYSFFATPGRDGKAKATSAKKITIGSKKQKVSAPSKSFTVPASAKVKVKFKLSKRNRNALKARTSLKFVVNVTVGSTKFSAKLKLKPPKKS